MLYMEKYKSRTKTIYLKYQLQHRTMNLNYLMDHILYKIILIISSKTMKETDNPPIRIYRNKIENRITFKMKIGYYLKLLTPEMMQLLGSTKNKITNDENGEIIEVLLVPGFPIVGGGEHGRHPPHPTILFLKPLPPPSKGDAPHAAPPHLKMKPLPQLKTTPIPIEK